MNDTFKLFKNYKIEKTKIKGRTYKLWVANTPQKRKLGLSKVRQLPQGYGMIFCFNELVDNSFTMKNTKIPLTIIFLDESFGIVDYFSCRPFSKKSIRPQKPYKYVIEI